MLKTIAFIMVIGIATPGCSRSEDAELFHRLSAKAEAGASAAQYNLGMLYNNGIGVEQNPAQAFRWFEKAANAGDPLGHYEVGRYYAGQFRGIVEVDEAKALTHKLVAAEAGYVLAQYDVALAYTYAGNFEEAAKWWKHAADQGDITGLWALAGWHKEGQGVPPDAAKAYEYLLTVVRLVPESQARQAKPLLDELRSTLDDATARKSEEAAASWVPKRSPLTLRAAQGIEEAKKLAL